MSISNEWQGTTLLRLKCATKDIYYICKKQEGYNKTGKEIFRINI